MRMQYVKGTHNNLLRVGWEHGTLAVEFKDKRLYHYGGVPEEVRDKLLRTPFPDALFQKIVRGKFVSKRIDPPQSRPLTPITTIPYDKLPF